MSDPRFTSSTQTLIDALRILGNDVVSQDGVANSVLFESADRLESFQNTVKMIRVYADAQCIGDEK